MLCILSLASNSIFEGVIKLFAFAACLLSWQTHGVCDNDWVSRSGVCYKVLDESSSIDSVYTARQMCLQQGADLISINNTEINNFLLHLVRNLTSPLPSHVYIGVTDLYGEGNFTLLNGNEAAYANFTASDGNNECVAVYSGDRQWSDEDTDWVDVPCCFQLYDSHAAVACEKPDDNNATVDNDVLHQKCFGDCPSGWEKYEGICYYALHSQTSIASTFEAREKCFAQNSDLIEISSVNLYHQAFNMLRKKSASESIGQVYIGAQDVNNDTEWMGPNNNNTSYTSWHADSPNNSNPDTKCAVLESGDGLWNNDSDVFWRDVHCCDDIEATWVLCEKPEGINRTEVALDDNVFAQKCFEEEDECESSPCQNEGTCEDLIHHYKCHCMDGYTGINCDTQINYCYSNPCQNNGTCNQILSAYFCDCAPGYSGGDCETLVDYCVAFEPCQNNATCNNTENLNNFTCDCSPGFEGVQCETNIDECVNMTCLNGGTCVDGIQTARCQCPTQYGGENCSISLFCSPSELIISNATIGNFTNSNLPGSVVTIECYEGHKFPDLTSSKTIECVADEDTAAWSPAYNQPYDYCEPHCLSQPVVANGSPDSNSTAVGVTLNYTCDTGYQLSDNSTNFNITCLATGNWSLSDVPQCEIIHCPEVPEFDYQTLDTRNTTYNTTITFWCDVGYVLPDLTIARTIKCLETGQWTATLPPCSAVECPQWNMDELDGISRNNNGYTYQTEVRYTCDSGLRMRDGATYRIIKCDATGEWSDNITECSDDRCFPLPYVGNATPSDTLAIYNHTVTLTCIDGHRFVDGSSRVKEKSMQCQPFGRWTPLLTACEPLFCPDTPSNVNSDPSTTNTLYGTVVDITCHTGYYFDVASFNKSVTIECIDGPTPTSSSAQWDIDYIEPCWPIVCSAPPNVSHINTTNLISEPANYNYSSVVKYQCIDEHRFIDGETTRNISCDEFGSWTHTDVSCNRERCEPVPMAAHVVPDTLNTSWFTNVTYQCETGYKWENIDIYEIMCQNTGYWNDTDIPFCTIKECATVPLMNNATTNETAHVYNTFVKYTCDPGFEYNDGTMEKVMWCSDYPQWEPIPDDFPKCNITYCPELIDVENATRNTNDTAYDTLVTYDCEPGYQFPDKSRSKTVYCTANQTWTEFPPACEVVFCPPVPFWDANYNSTDNNFLAVVSYECSEFDAFEDSNKDTSVVKRATCLTSKEWDPPLVKCVPLESLAKDLVGVSYDSEESVPIGTIAVSLMCIMIAAIILLDMQKIISDLKMMKDNIKSLMDEKNKVSDSRADIKEAEESSA